MQGRFTKDYWIIKWSGLFDPAYYLRQYPDVRHADVDPLEHFVLHGWKEGRNPNEWFNTMEYLEKNPDGARAGINPFVHWIRYGRFEGREPIPTFAESKKFHFVPFIYLLLGSLKNPRLIFKFFEKTRKMGFKTAFQVAQNRLLIQKNYSLWIQMYDKITEEDRDKIKKHILMLKYKPFFSIIMPVYNTPEKLLRKAIESVLNQLYPYWELCIADDASTEPHVRKVLEEYKEKDSRIKVVYRERNGHISEASNTALEVAKGDFVVFLDHDDELTEHALYMLTVELNNYPDANIIYSDEDKIDENGNRFDPYFKPDFNYLLLLGQNYMAHLIAYRTNLIKELGGLRSGYEGAQDWDLVLRAVEKVPEETVRHIPFILYHWRVTRGSTAMGINEKTYAREAQYRALKKHLEIKGIKAELYDVNNVHWRIKFALPENLPCVSIIIPTRDRLDLISRCVNSILTKTNYPNYEIIILDNGSKEEKTLRYFDEVSKHNKIKVIRYDIPFNYSKINNYAVQYAKGELLLFLNNDTEVINPDWLEEMVPHIIREEVGIVGAMLYYPDNTIQHAGVILGIGGVAGHAYRFFPKGHPGQSGRVWLAQYMSAVTGACLLIKRKVFEEVGGFEEDLAVAFNDVDLCLKVLSRGYKIVWTPYAELYHYEGISRGKDTIENPRFRKEIEYMQNKWGHILYRDPAYNPNLTLEKEDFSLAFPPRIRKPWEDIF